MAVAGLVAAVANLAVLTGGSDLVEVVVVAQDTPPGTPVAQVAVRTTALPGQGDHVERLVTPTMLEGDLADLATGQRLAAGSLLRQDDLEAVATTGAGAMSIPIDPGRAVGGSLVRGDVVDVLAAVDGEVVAIVDGADVLAVTAGGGGLGGASAGHAVTLSVSDEQAMSLSRAMRAGELDLVRTTGGAR